MIYWDADKAGESENRLGRYREVRQKSAGKPRMAKNNLAKGVNVELVNRPIYWG